MEKTKEINKYLQHQNKLFIHQYAKEFSSVTKTLQQLNIPKSTSYKWTKAYVKDGDDGLHGKHPVAYNHPNRLKDEIIEKVLSLRKAYGRGSCRIKWYLELYPTITNSESSISRILKRYGVERLQKKASRRALHSD